MEHADRTGPWDVIVVGAGMAGGVAARRLTERGLRVLVLETGPGTLPDAPRPSRARRMLRKVAGGFEPRDQDRWPDRLRAARAGHAARLVPAMMGRGRGGSSALYGAALGRFRRIDFEREAADGPQGGAPDPAIGERPLPTRWPIAFDALKPYYVEAEALLGVTGGRDPLDPEDDAVLAPPPPLSPQDAALARTLVANGLHPFRLHVGFAYRPGCAECLGQRCPRGCKAEGDSRGLGPALRDGRATLLQGATARRIEPGEAGVAIVVALEDGAERTIRARSCVVAAGALNSPLLLARSPRLWGPGGPPRLLGRGLMFHVTDMLAVFERSGAAAFGPRKTLGFRDFYKMDGAICGEVQSMGIALEAGMIATYLKGEAQRLGLGRLGPWLDLLRIPAGAAARLTRNAAVFATILEDLPYAANRVWEDDAPARAPSGAIALSYTVSADLAARAARMRQALRAAFAPNRVLFLSRPATPNWGHPMGTCRMAADPEAGVTRPDGALWTDDRVRVADASVLPSSGGANPSLTIAANALRIADLLAGRLAAERVSPAATEPA